MIRECTIANKFDTSIYHRIECRVLVSFHQNYDVQTNFSFKMHCCFFFIVLSYLSSENKAPYASREHLKKEGFRGHRIVL